MASESLGIIDTGTMTTMTQSREDSLGTVDHVHVQRWDGNMAVGSTAFSSERRAKLSEWAVLLAQASCYSQAALSSNDSKTRYVLS